MFNLSECPAKRDPELWQWIDAEAINFSNQYSSSTYFTLIF